MHATFGRWSSGRFYCLGRAGALCCPRYLRTDRQTRFSVRACVRVCYADQTAYGPRVREVLSLAMQRAAQPGGMSFLLRFTQYLYLASILL